MGTFAVLTRLTMIDMFSNIRGRSTPPMFVPSFIERGFES